MTDNIKEDVQAEVAAQEIKLTKKQYFYKFLRELLDMLKGAAFPFIVMCVFSTTIILFYSFDDAAVQLLAVIVGEALMIASFIMFGRQNGAAAFRKTKLNEAKRKLGKTDKPLIYKTGEYSPYKGFVIGFITSVPFLVLQIIKCTGDYKFVDYLLEYACGWAVSPFSVIGGIPQPFYLLMILFPVCIHGGFYIQGKFSEVKRQEAIKRAEDDMRKGKKKHYYQENNYEKESRVRVDMSDFEKKGKNGRKSK